MSKKIISILGVVFFAILLWYLFLKPYDYLVSFKAKTFPGAINQAIKTWGQGSDSITNLGQEDIYNIKQKIVSGDTSYDYYWNIVPINDSLSKVKVYVKDTKNSLKNKISIPFSETPFEVETKSTILDFTDKLKEHIGKFKVKIEGIAEYKSTYCAYVPLEGTQYGKASAMMRDYSLLSNTLAANKVKLNGSPFIEITHWDINKDSIVYNFCYPIIKSDSLPMDTPLKYKQFNGGKGVKAVYNGNYITSDRAWYALMDYAKKKSISIEQKPIEVFYSNPSLGGNELKWKAEIFMPLKPQDE